MKKKKEIERRITKHKVISKRKVVIKNSLKVISKRNIVIKQSKKSSGRRKIL